MWLYCTGYCCSWVVITNKIKQLVQGKNSTHTRLTQHYTINDTWITIVQQTWPQLYYMPTKQFGGLPLQTGPGRRHNQSPPPRPQNNWFSSAGPDARLWGCSAASSLCGSGNWSSAQSPHSRPSHTGRRPSTDTSLSNTQAITCVSLCQHIKLITTATLHHSDRYSMSGKLRKAVTLTTREGLQGSTLAVFRYPENPRFPDGIPDSPEQ